MSKQTKKETTEAELREKLEAHRLEREAKGRAFLEKWLIENNFVLETPMPIIIGGVRVGVNLRAI